MVKWQLNPPNLEKEEEGQLKACGTRCQGCGEKAIYQLLPTQRKVYKYVEQRTCLRALSQVSLRVRL